jgi:hypothetical protein
MLDRNFQIHYARVLIGQVRARRNIPAWRAYSFCLLEQAAEARRRAATLSVPKQAELF